VSGPHFGVTLPQIKRSWKEASEAAIQFEQLGFNSVWVCDHLFGVPNPSLPIMEAWTELAAVAAITKTVELGTLVTPPFFRHPAVLAKQVSTIEQVAPGRPVIGLGAGWFEAEFEGYGVPFPSLPHRLVALQESLEIINGLYKEKTFSFEGKYFNTREAILEPKPKQMPKILIGGGGEKILLKIAARHADIWNNLAVFQKDLERKITILKKHCETVGRDFSEITVSQQCMVVVSENEKDAMDALNKAKKIYGEHMGRGLEEHGIWGPPNRVIDCIEAHRKIGCEHFIIEFFGRDTRVPAMHFAETVIPAFR